MRIENEFDVAAPIERVWAHLLDVHAIAPCAPGAELTEVIDDRTWKGKLNMKMGPISLSFAGTVVMQERDDQAHRGVLKAEGREQKGKGAGSAVVTSTLTAAGDSTHVRIETDLTITGTIAQYGRGMIGDISQRMTGEFARCLEASILADAGAGPAGAAQAGEPPGGSPSTGGAEAEGGGAAAGSTDPEAALESGGRPQGSAAASPPAPLPAGKPVAGLRLGLWALWRALVRLVRRLFGGGAGRTGG